MLMWRVHQIKFDIKSMAQIFEMLPDIDGAQSFAPLEANAWALIGKQFVLSNVVNSKKTKI